MVDSMDQIEKYITTNIKTFTKENVRLSDVAYECLKAAIINVDVQAGDHLSEPRLAVALGISRTPIRTAIQQLIQDGLLQQVPGRAVVIASRSIKQLIDALDIRRLLEPEVCRLVAGNFIHKQETIFQQYTQELIQAAEAADRKAWTRIDDNWHQILCHNCPNQLLGQMALQAKNHMHKQGVRDQVSDEYILSGTQEHAIIADALIAGDSETASQLMVSHLNGVRQYLFPNLRMNDDLTL